MFDDAVYTEASNKCLAFMKSQLNVSNFIYPISFGEAYSDSYAGDVIWGTVSGLPAEDEKVHPQHINMAEYYDYYYTGQVVGVWFGLDNPSEYTVDVYVIRDIEYLVCSCELESNGTWRTKKTVTVTVTEIDEETGEPYTYTYEEEVDVNVQQGIKEARLMKDGVVVDYAYSYFTNFKVRLYSYSDTEYLSDEVKIWDVGQGRYLFYTHKVYTGKKIAKVIQRVWSNGAFVYNTVGIAGALTNATTGRIPASFLVPSDDPQYNKDGSNANNIYGYMLNSRCFIYDVGLALLVFTTSGDYDICREMLTRMQYEQNPDGSFNFSYDLYIGQLMEGYVRTGAIGWLVWGMCYYTLKSGDTSFIGMISKAGGWLLTRQVTSYRDLRYGLLTGGYGNYNMSDYSYIEGEIEWCSTEHNCSALQALHGLALVTGEVKYTNAANLLKNSLYTKLYDKENKRFYQGISKDGIDTAWALDCTTWAGSTSLSILSVATADACRITANEVYLLNGVSIVQSSEKDYYNQRYSSQDTFSGFMPYSDRTADYEGAPRIVWSEGTIGYAALCLALGRYSEAKVYVDEMIKLQNCTNGTGGVLYATATYAMLPWEFHVWESVASSAWLYLVINNPGVLFPQVLTHGTYFSLIKPEEDTTPE